MNRAGGKKERGKEGKRERRKRREEGKQGRGIHGFWNHFGIVLGSL